MRTAHRGLSILVIVAMTMLMSAAVAAAQEEYPPQEPAEGDANCPEQVIQGGDTTCVGRGFEPGSDVLAEAFINGELVASETVTANRGGVARFTFEVPCTALRGQEGLVRFTGVSDEGGPLVAEDSFTVGGELPVCPEGTPTTGANVTNGLAIAVVVLIIGAGLLATSRRRESETV